MKDPLPPRSEDELFRDVREHAGVPEASVQGPRYDDLPFDLRDQFAVEFDRLAGQSNPFARRVVRRTRPMLEEAGLLKPIGVVSHPRAADSLPLSLFDGEGLDMGFAFKEAYAAAEAFCRRYAVNRPGAGFLKTILLRRIGSSPAAGLATAEHLLAQGDSGVEEPELGDAEPLAVGAQPPLVDEERGLLRTVCENLRTVTSSPDPKVEVIATYLRDRNWLRDHGAIIFSQYLTTSEWVAERLAAIFPEEPLALYAGGSASFVISGGARRHAAREEIKAAVQRGAIRLLIATDAACEGLNLQKLGAQINVDLPWNPSRLEQRKGRVQRIGQTRPEIHVVNLRYAATVEDDVYSALSRRFGDIFSVLGQLPDSFEDEWIDKALTDRDALRAFREPRRAGASALGQALLARPRRGRRPGVGTRGQSAVLPGPRRPPATRVVTMGVVRGFRSVLSEPTRPRAGSLPRSDMARSL